MEKEIIKHLRSTYPQEGCGLIVNVRGKLQWKPCKNVSKNPLESFKIEPSSYAAASLVGDIFAVVHSHPDQSPDPSEQDIKSSNFLQIPYHIYSIPSEDKYEYIPEYKKIPLLGRTYEFGKTDCWTLARDYYKQTFNVDIPMLEFEDDFYEKGINYFEDLKESFGFMSVSSPNIGDIIIFNIDNEIPNHCGIYLGEDIFMHHAEGRLSCRESLPRWNKYIRSFYTRCKKFI